MLPNLGRLALDVPHVGPSPAGTATIPLGATTVKGADTTNPEQVLEQEPTMDCGICLEKINLFHPNTWILACAASHAFHTICLRNWYVGGNPDARKRCPECRATMTPETRGRIVAYAYAASAASRALEVDVAEEEEEAAWAAARARAVAEARERRAREAAEGEGEGEWEGGGRSSRQRIDARPP